MATRLLDSMSFGGGLFSRRFCIFSHPVVVVWLYRRGGGGGAPKERMGPMANWWLWKDGWVAESTSLLRMRTPIGTVGSNPTLSVSSLGGWDLLRNIPIIGENIFTLALGSGSQVRSGSCCSCWWCGCPIASTPSTFWHLSSVILIRPG